MKRLTIEWKHLEHEGRTCERCGDTGDSLRKAVRKMRRHCMRCDVEIRFIKTKLPARRLKESNTLLFNGVPLETALRDATLRASDCDSCSTLVGTKSQCRAVERGGEVRNAIPEEWIWEAACRVARCECPK